MRPKSRSSTTTSPSERCLTLPPYLDLRGDDARMQEKTLARRRSIARDWLGSAYLLAAPASLPNDAPGIQTVASYRGSLLPVGDPLPMLPEGETVQVHRYFTEDRDDD